MKKAPFPEGLYVISDSPETLMRAVDDGATIVQLRIKEGTEPEILERAATVIAYKRVKPFIFVLNDNPHLAATVKADGVHVGQDTSTTETRRIIGEGMMLGKTTHNLEQAREAVRDGADYISAGPVHATPTKPGRPAVGVQYVREVAENLSIPFVALGGIDLSNIDEVLAAGARTIAVVRAAGQTRALVEKIGNYR